MQTMPEKENTMTTTDHKAKDELRAQFEASIIEHGRTVKSSLAAWPDEPERYQFPRIQFMWEGYQLAHTALQQKAEPVLPIEQEAKLFIGEAMLKLRQQHGDDIPSTHIRGLWIACDACVKYRTYHPLPHTPEPPALPAERAELVAALRDIEGDGYAQLRSAQWKTIADVINALSASEPVQAEPLTDALVEKWSAEYQAAVDKWEAEWSRTVPIPMGPLIDVIARKAHALGRKQGLSEALEICENSTQPRGAIKARIQEIER